MLKAVAQQGYGDDDFGIIQLPGLSGLLLTPKDDPNDTHSATDATHRVLYRFQQMWDSTQGQ